MLGKTNPNFNDFISLLFKKNLAKKKKNLHSFGTPNELGGTLFATTFRKKTVPSKFVISFLRYKY
jgi:hypothetical protein